MNRIHLFSCICFFIFLNNSYKNLEHQFGNKISKLNSNHPNALTDTIWKALAIVKLKDPAPGGGNFEEFGDHYFLESGAFVFWAQHGKKNKEWALYNYKNGNTKLVVKAFEKTTEPDGVSKEFICMAGPLLSVGQTRISFGGASSKVLYITEGAGAVGHFDNIYSWDGEKIKKVIGEGDKISVSGNKGIIIKGVRLEWITDDNQALIFFVGDDPDKTKGWMLHDGNNLKPLFIVGDELPGSPGIKLKGLIIDGTYHDKIYINKETIIANMFVDNAPNRQGIFRISKNKTELIESAKGISPLILLHAEGPDNFIFKFKDIYYYNHGKRLSILENKKELPGKLQFNDYDIINYVLTGQEKEAILFSTGGIRPAIYQYSEGKIINIVKIDNSPGRGFTPTAFPLKTIPGVNGIFAPNLRVKSKDDLYLSSYFDPSSKETKLVPAPELKTTGTDRFDLGDIIAVPDENKLIVKHTPFFGITGFYELTK